MHASIGRNRSNFKWVGHGEFTLLVRLLSGDRCLCQKQERRKKKSKEEKEEKEGGKRRKKKSKEGARKKENKTVSLKEFEVKPI